MLLNKLLSRFGYISKHKNSALMQHAFYLSLIEGVPHQNFIELTPLKIKEGKGTYSIFDINIQLNFYAHIKQKAEKILVLLPGAVDRTKGDIIFQRFSWSDSIPAHVISFADPTISRENDINIGWFQNNQKQYGVEYLAKVILHIANLLDVNADKILCFGSSAGGFTALKLSEYIDKVTAIAINPQLIVKNYSAKFVNRMCQAAYKTDNFDTVASEFSIRAKINNRLEMKSNRMVIYQNEADKEHVNLHLTPYLSMVDSRLIDKLIGINSYVFNKKLTIVHYNDEIARHSPPDKKVSLDIIMNGLNNLSK